MRQLAKISIPLGIFLIFSLAAFVCARKPVIQTPVEDNPAAPGFDAAHSDVKAIEIADACMRAMGGRKAWDETACINWTFFGRRQLWWNKKTGMARIEWANRPLKIIVNLNDNTGKVLLDGVLQTHPDSLSKYLDIGKKVWVNDSYWLVFPYKLKDSGVTLRYLGETADSAGEAADKLELTFKGVGVTPDNKYYVWIEKSTHLVTQWAYFEKYTDENPKIINAWGDYQLCGKILLSAGRGERGTLKPLQVLDPIPAGLFEQF